MRISRLSYHHYLSVRKHEESTMFLVKLIIVICFVGIATSSPMSGDLSTALLEQPIKPPSPNRSIKFHHHSTNTVGQLTILSKKWSVVSELHCARGCLDITGCQATIFIQEKFLCVLLKMSQKHDQETVVYDNPDVWLKKDAKGILINLCNFIWCYCNIPKRGIPKPAWEFIFHNIRLMTC